MKITKSCEINVFLNFTYLSDLIFKIIEIYWRNISYFIFNGEKREAPWTLNHQLEKFRTVMANPCAVAH